ncbi:MAG: penicillin-binding protein 1B [Gammaproteobacteria bacterium]|nr:penicillin-binding protein 1B [Gammaproteobacteria bacterium]
MRRLSDTVERIDPPRYPALKRYILYGTAAVLLAFAGYAGWLMWRITTEFDDRAWDLPAQVYASPLELYEGRRLGIEDLQLELQRLGYGPVAGRLGPGFFRRDGGTISLWRRAFVYDGRPVPEQLLRVELAGGRVESLEDGDGGPVAIAELEPLLIGSIFPTHGEDRIILAPDEVPELLTEALKAVEDRRFEEHMGVDVRAIARAALANLRAGGISQGGSTLTMQLVRSYFLTNAQTFNRKFREALMALVLELRHSKDEIMLAYVNEIYLGQNGGRAVHGFGLASRFYFGKPLVELDVHEIALLVAIVRGPSYYDPRRNPERALARRALVLEQMRAAGLIDEQTATAAAERDIGVVTPDSRRTAYYPAFMDLVRRQLRRDYDDEDLEQRGLTIYTTMQPAVQAAAEEALVEELERLQPGRPELDGAVVVTNPHTAEVLALVGGRRTGFDGFNRALDARRQAGSLIKPVVYLAALESGRHSLATHIDDEPITVELDDGRTWSPKNIDGETHGQVTAVRALAESLNLATVHLGLDVGLERVADVFERFGIEPRGRLYPSLLLGAVELTPIDVTQVYNTLANGGFRVPLRAVRAVVDGQGRTLQRYALAIRQVADPVSIYALNQALVQVMERGTGVQARRLLPAALRTAGKTGTSDDLRDSWFAGFADGHLVVTWVGNDGNAAVNLTGGTGASQVWARVMRSVDARSYAPPPPAGAEALWIDYRTGLATDSDCPEAVFVAMTAPEVPPKAVACGSTTTRIGSRIRQWFRNRLQ